MPQKEYWSLRSHFNTWAVFCLIANGNISSNRRSKLIDLNIDLVTFFTERYSCSTLCPRICFLFILKEHNLFVFWSLSVDYRFWHGTRIWYRVNNRDFVRFYVDALCSRANGSHTLFKAKGNLSKQQIYSSPRIGKSEYFDFMHIIPFAIPGQKRCLMLGMRLITGK